MNWTLFAEMHANFDVVFVDESMTCAEEIELLSKNDNVLCSDMCRPTCRYDHVFICEGMTS